MFDCSKKWKHIVKTRSVRENKSSVFEINKEVTE